MLKPLQLEDGFFKPPKIMKCQGVTKMRKNASYLEAQTFALPSTRQRQETDVAKSKIERIAMQRQNTKSMGKCLMAAETANSQTLQGKRKFD